VRHAVGVDADLMADPVGDEVAALDEAPRRLDGHAECGGHVRYREEARELIGLSRFELGRLLKMFIPRSQPTSRG
jgi:hypothetical protein